MPCASARRLPRIWQSSWIDEVALHEAKRPCSLIHRRDKSGLGATHCLGQYHGRIIAGSGDYCEDSLPHGDLISSGNAKTGAALPGGMGGNLELLVEVK